MHDRTVAHLSQPDQQPPHLAFAQLQLDGCLPLCDQLLLCLFQHYQTVAFPMGHGENSWFFHPPSLTLSIGHFYLAQLGHSHVAPTLDYPQLDYPHWTTHIVAAK
jgi:hypothetical protein